MGLTLDMMENLTLGMVWDIMTEKGNDSYEYAEIATAEDIRAFAGL